MLALASLRAERGLCAGDVQMQMNLVTDSNT